MHAIAMAIIAHGISQNRTLFNEKSELGETIRDALLAFTIGFAVILGIME